MMDAVDVIITKRDAGQLTERQIRWFVDGYTKGTIADEQASALLMAILLNGMGPTETTTWTRAMVSSGERLDLSSVSRPTVDKHSSGGVGDKVSLVVAPIAAACGLAAPKLSGRGLGHTGGTIDKLESIPGLRTSLSTSEMLKVLDEVGCVICEAGAELAPADQKLYALRNATGTVDSLPLIASSIMSKKIAGGAAGLVLDVKVGAGAFFADVEDAAALAEAMVQIGEAEGMRTRAVLTGMEAPLGRAVGNALEVQEAIDALRGEGPPDLMEVVSAIATEMLAVAGVESDPMEALSTGAAAARFEAMVSAQGGDLAGGLPVAAHRHTLEASESGSLVRLDARRVGMAALRLGAGRTRKQDPISPGAGIVCLKKPGENVDAGEPLLELFADDQSRFEAGLKTLGDAIEIGEQPGERHPLVIDRIPR